jgi:hypothetical protein
MEATYERFSLLVANSTGEWFLVEPERYESDCQNGASIFIRPTA